MLLSTLVVRYHLLLVFLHSNFTFLNWSRIIKMLRTNYMHWTWTWKSADLLLLHWQSFPNKINFKFLQFTCEMKSCPSIICMPLALTTARTFKTNFLWIFINLEYREYWIYGHKCGKTGSQSSDLSHACNLHVFNPMPSAALLILC